MARNANWHRRRQQEAWAFGREQRDRLLRDYTAEYGLSTPPPPAKIIDELLTDFLHVRLRYDPLPLDRFAETRIIDGRVVVSVNAHTEAIGGVKDAAGVQNVAKWHEAIHAIADIDVLRNPPQQAFAGFDVVPAIVCYRGPKNVLTARDDEAAREFWAEEAGRAAAVSIEALQRSGPFTALMRAAGRSTGAVSGAWPMLYEATAEIGVNITALVKQLQLEGLIVIERHGDRNDVLVQSTLIEATS